MVLVGWVYGLILVVGLWIWSNLGGVVYVGIQGLA